VRDLVGRVDLLAQPVPGVEARRVGETGDARLPAQQYRVVVEHVETNALGIVPVVGAGTGNEEVGVVVHEQLSRGGAEHRGQEQRRQNGKIEMSIGMHEIEPQMMGYVSLESE